MKTIDKRERKAKFLFRNSEALQELIDKFYRGELRIEPMKYFNELRTIKARLYSE